MKPFTIKRTAGWFVALAVIVAASYSPEVRAQSTVAVELQSGKHGGEFLVPVNKSQILRVDVPFTDLLVGNEEIADVLPLTNRTIYVLGKSLGSTSLSIYGPGKRLIAIVDLMVTYDVQGLKSRLFDHLNTRPMQTCSGVKLPSRMLSKHASLPKPFMKNSQGNRLLIIAHPLLTGKQTWTIKPSLNFKIC